MGLRNRRSYHIGHPVFLANFMRYRVKNLIGLLLFRALANHRCLGSGIGILSSRAAEDAGKIIFCNGFLQFIFAICSYTDLKNQSVKELKHE